MRDLSPLGRYHAAIKVGTLSPDAGQERAARHLDKFYHLILSPVSGSWMDRFFSFFPGARSAVPVQTGLYLHGPVGRGKTHLMDMFFEALPDSVLKRRVHFHAFMISVHDFLHAARAAGGAAGVDDVLPRFAADLARGVHVLCFDEFHVADVADAMILSRLFTALFAAGVRVVMTSNYPPDDLYTGGLQRDLFLPFIALVKDRMDVVAVDGGVDYRRAHDSLVPENATYLSPLGHAAEEWADAIFARLAAASAVPPAPVTLTVKGHDVFVPMAAGRVMRADFSDLCERPLAAQDYLALADRFDTFVITRVPRLTYDRRNETKRFILLIDVLYERRRRVYITAAAAPDHLYVDGAHAFEFDRTVSRLVEMQSAGYGSGLPLMTTSSKV